MWPNTSVVKGGSIWILKNIMLLPFLDLTFEKKKSRLALLGSLWISPLTTNERTLDTLILHIRIFNLWRVHQNVDLWYCHIAILIKINHCFITWIIYVISFIRLFCVTLYKWMGKTCCGKSAAENTEINKKKMFWFWICHFVYSYHKTILFSAPKQSKIMQNQNGHCLVKMTRYEQLCYAPIFQTEYHFSVFLSLILIF